MPSTANKLNNLGYHNRKGKNQYTSRFRRIDMKPIDINDLESSKKCKRSFAIGKLIITSIIGIGILFAAVTVFSELLSNNTKEPSFSEITKTVQESENEYRASCKAVNYKDLCRYPDEYLGTRICLTIQITQIFNQGASSPRRWIGRTDNDGYGLYFGDEYYFIDKRASGSVKLLADDVITVYGNFVGLEKLTRALTDMEEEFPKIEVRYADLLAEDSAFNADSEEE